MYFLFFYLSKPLYSLHNYVTVPVKHSKDLGCNGEKSKLLTINNHKTQFIEHRTSIHNIYIYLSTEVNGIALEELSQRLEIQRILLYRPGQLLPPNNSLIVGGRVIVYNLLNTSSISSISLSQSVYEL